MATWAPNRQAKHLFAVLRLDPPHGGEWGRVLADPGQYVSVKEVVPTMEEAQREVERLSGLRDGSASVYFAQLACVYRTGRRIDV